MEKEQNQDSDSENKISEEKIATEEIKEENIVKSPMVGVAYLSADPDSPAYVKVGQHVKAGDTLLLIEAMKTFNEIPASSIAIPPDIAISNEVPRSGCLIIKNTGINIIIAAVNM